MKTVPTIDSKPFESRVYGVHFGHHKTEQAAINKIKRVHSEIRNQCGGVPPVSIVTNRITGERKTI